MMFQTEITLAPRSRGIYLITDEVFQALKGELPDTGLLNVFLCHSSAGLCLGENTDPDVLRDLEDALDHLAPDEKHYRHADEGPDDMPAHIKQTITGASLTIPVMGGKPALGRWQGIYLCEFRDRGGERKIILTANG